MEKLVVANIKMNILSPSERDKYIKAVKKELKNKNFKKCEFVFCPPFIHLEGFSKAKIKNSSIGGQNVFWENRGSFTGEVSSKMLKDVGCSYVILGHSERRRYSCEQDSEINLKVIAALKGGLNPILCVGERAGENSDIILKQLENCLKNVSRAKIEKVVLCYEPVWAISSNNPDHMPTANDIMSAKLLIKKFLVRKYGVKVSEKVKIIYGGSVSKDNAMETCVKSEMDGALVGKESLTPYKFIRIGQIINENA